MKLNLDETVAKGVAITYTRKNIGDCPAYIEKILAIPGVSSVFRLADFMAIQRKPTAGWEDILSQARAVLEYASLNNTKPEPAETSDKKWREVTVSVQYFRDLPMLVKVSPGDETPRLPLPERFGLALDGEPFAGRYELNQTQALIDRLGIRPPRLKVYDPVSAKFELDDALAQTIEKMQAKAAAEKAAKEAVERRLERTRTSTRSD